MKLTCTEDVDPYGFEDIEYPSLEGTGGSRKESSKSANLKGEAVKVSVILRPEHKKWVEKQDFGLSEWIRNRIDGEIGEKTNSEEKPDKEREPTPPGKKEKMEGREEKDSSLPSDHLCSVCGEKEATTKIMRNGNASYLCEDCMREVSNEPSQEKNQGGDSDPTSNPTCEMCEMNEAVEQVPMGPGRDKMWLCETCMQEEGFRQTRRH